MCTSDRAVSIPVSWADPNLPASRGAVLLDATGASVGSALPASGRTALAILQEMLLTTTPERQGRVIDHDSSGPMEEKAQDGYF